MKRTMAAAAALVALLAAGAASASIERASAVRNPPATEAQDATLKLKQAFVDIGHGDYAKAEPELDDLIAAPGFDRLSVEVRYQVLNVAAAIALQYKHYAKAHGLATRATGFDQAAAGTWMARLVSALFISDFRDAGRCIQTVAERWPDQLDNIRPQSIVQLHHSLTLAHENDVDRAMLEALFDADWQAGSSTYDTLWRDLALMQVEHGQAERAAKVVERIGSAETAVSMRVDKRFDAIARSHPLAFDVDRLLDAQIQAARARIKAHPDQLEAVHRLQDLLLRKGQNAEVLAISEAAVAHAEHGDGEQAYRDFEDNYNWVLNQRALAFAHEGRWDDAVREMARAAKRPENGGVNVSQSINLAGLYTDLDEPDQAAAAIVEPGEMSEYGRMQLEYVWLQIAIEKNDAQAIAERMAYLKEHRADDIATWQRALLRHGDLDAAAAVLVERLKSPDWRNRALVEMQHYRHSAQTPTMKMMDRRWKTVSSRADVQAALTMVGRVEHFALVMPAY